MAKKKGRTLLVKIGDGATPTEGFTTLCGLQSKTFTVNNTEIDVTTADCIDPGGPLWSEVLSGTKRLSISGNGIFEDSLSELRLNTIAMAAEPQANFQVIVPDFGTFQGAFFLSSVEYGGEQEGGVTYSLSLGSSGICTFAAAP